jgi:uncharacterized membrane protein YfcA
VSLPDIINGLFEAFGFFAVGASCLRLMKDKEVKGVSLVTTAFFTSWGFWNLYFYPSLGQSLSGVAAGAVCLANCFWCFLIIKYRGAK